MQIRPELKRHFRLDFLMIFNFNDIVSAYFLIYLARVWIHLVIETLGCERMVWIVIALVVGVGPWSGQPLFLWSLFKDDYSVVRLCLAFH